MSDHPRHRLDELIHAPIRFSIMATLAGAGEAEFALVRDLVEISDSVLSKQVALLEEAGYIAVRKGYVGKRPRTWLALTGRGRAAFHGHLAVLREISGTEVAETPADGEDRSLDAGGHIKPAH